MTTAVVLSIVAGTCVGGFVSGVAGFAFGLTSLAIWVWLIEPHFLAPMAVFGSLVAQTLSYGAVRHSFEWRKLTPFLIGGIVGLPFGVKLLDVINLHLFRITVGVILIVYCSATLLMTNIKPIKAGGRIADAFAGAIGGAMGGLAGLTGPAPTLWCTVRGWDKDTQRCIFQGFNLAMQGITLVAYWFSGNLTFEVGKIFALMVPAIIVPTFVGVKLYKRIDAVLFRRLVLSLLLLSGVVLLVSTLSRH